MAQSYELWGQIKSPNLKEASKAFTEKPTVLNNYSFIWSVGIYYLLCAVSFSMDETKYMKCVLFRNLEINMGYRTLPK